MAKTHETLLTFCALVMVSSAVHAAPTGYKRRDVRMGTWLYLQPNNAKAGEEIKTGNTSSAQALDNPNDKEEVKKKKMVIFGFPGNYYLGYHVFHDWTHNDFPTMNKSIYQMSGVGSSPKITSLVGTDIMFEGYPPVHFLNSPWQKIGDGDVTQRTSTVKVNSLQFGMNFFTVELDPFDKIFEYEKPAPKNGKEAPVSRLENNNNAIFAIEIIKPPILTLPIKPKG
ncbi:hypothetical protein IAD21_01506 [Abditibacteriota bacterium]|nr:hypothetical protein IAD21_01506 [Abditibacteriota bacterium]